jgi:transcriptional regulator with XRE-family HTH domain
MTNSVYTRRYQRFRDLLVEARQARKLSQAALAQKLGRLQTFVSKYERGERRLDVVEFLEVSHALALDPHKVLKLVAAADRP